MVAIPSSLLATFVVMRAMGLTLDNVSLMGLSLIIGILVDDSIVVLENITRHRDMGQSPNDAAISGRTRDRRRGDRDHAGRRRRVRAAGVLERLRGPVPEGVRHRRHRGDAVLAVRVLHAHADARGEVVGAAPLGGAAQVADVVPDRLRPADGLVQGPCAALRAAPPLDDVLAERAAGPQCPHDGRRRAGDDRRCRRRRRVRGARAGLVPGRPVAARPRCGRHPNRLARRRVRRRRRSLRRDRGLHAVARGYAPQRPDGVRARFEDRPDPRRRHVPGRHAARDDGKRRSSRSRTW